MLSPHSSGGLETERSPFLVSPIISDPLLSTFFLSSPTPPTRKFPGSPLCLRMYLYKTNFLLSCQSFFQRESPPPFMRYLPGIPSLSQELCHDVQGDPCSRN